MILIISIIKLKFDSFNILINIYKKKLLKMLIIDKINFYINRIFVRIYYNKNIFILTINTYYIFILIS